MINLFILNVVLPHAAKDEITNSSNLWTVTQMGCLILTSFFRLPAQTCQCRIGLRNLTGKENRNTCKSASWKTSWFCWRSRMIFQHLGHFLNFLCKAPCILLTVKKSKCKCLWKIQIQICSWSKWWGSNWFQWENMEPWWLKTIWQVLQCRCSVICFPVLSVCALQYF